MFEFVLSDVFDLKADLLVVPVSENGSISFGFEKALADLGVIFKSGAQLQLGEIRIQQISSTRNFDVVAFVCTVFDYGSTYSAIRHIGHELGKMANGEIRTIAAPILGSGAGRLDPSLVLPILRSAFIEKAAKNAKLICCTNDQFIFEEFRDISATDLSSAELAIRAELPAILKNERINAVTQDHQFFYQRAKEKFTQFSHFEENRSFFQNIADQFRTAKLPYQQYLRSLSAGSKAFQFVQLCGELIAYIDFSAYNKKNWNTYDDKRVLARSGVNQSLWFGNLIKVKLQGGFANLAARSVRNALQFLAEPKTELTMLSEEHRKMVFKELLLVPYEGSAHLYPLFDFFRRLSIFPVNQENEGAVYSRLLYLPEVKRLWYGETAGTEDIALEGIDSDLELAKHLIDQSLLTGEKELDLGSCGLRNLDDLPELFDCYHLEVLILSNEWAIYENGKWREKFSGNRGKPNVLSAIPRAIGKLENLKRLYCGGNWQRSKEEWLRWSIKEVASLTNLKRLEYLNLSNNAIARIAPLRQLTALTELHLNNNQIKSLYLLDSMTSLRHLFVSNNRISSVVTFKDMFWLQTLDLHRNRVRDLSNLESLIEKIGIKNSSWEPGTISIAKNPLSLPSMNIVDLGARAVLQTLQDIRGTGAYINTDIKIILIGNSEAGKSTMVKYLDSERDLERPHPATVWMNEKVVKSKYDVKRIGKQCDLHLFDFGGHDFYHDTHYMFYSTNAAYILLWDKELEHLRTRSLVQTDRKGRTREFLTQDYPIKYWLESVRYFTKLRDSENLAFKTQKNDDQSSPLLLIQNKVGSHPEIRHLANKELSDEYGFIYEFLNISIKEPKRNLDYFDVVFTSMLNEMEIIGEKLPAYYRPIKQQLNIYSGKPVLNHQEFLDFCNGINGVKIDTAQCKVVVSYLEQIGQVLNAKLISGDRIYLDKKWIIDHMQPLLEGLSERRGEFNKPYAIAQLGGSEDAFRDIIALMLEFKIVFRHPHRPDTFVAPLYLPSIPDATVRLFLNKRNRPYRRFEYTGFIHKQIMLNFFEQYGQQIKHGENESTYYYWKDGLILKQDAKDDTDEIIMIQFHPGNDEGNAKIDVYCLQGSQKPLFVETILAFIRQLNANYDYEEMVSIDGDDFVSIQLLQKNALAGKWVFSERRLDDLKKPSGEPEKVLNLKDFQTFIDPVKRKKVVISYSKKNLSEVHMLRRYLQPLVADQLIDEPWYCTNFLAADEWEIKLKSKFVEADIIFYMISDYFYTTKFITDYEIPTGIDRYDRGEAVKIIPVILEHYDWKREKPYNLQRFSGLPYQMKPISDFYNPRVAWNTITSSVRLMIEKDLDPAKDEVVSREIQELLERQVAGKLDRNS